MNQPRIYVGRLADDWDLDEATEQITIRLDQQPGYDAIKWHFSPECPSFPTDGVVEMVGYREIGNRKVCETCTRIVRDDGAAVFKNIRRRSSQG